jgi:hypothetical protein
MNAIRLRVSADADGEILLRGLPIRRGEEAEIIVLTESDDGLSTDEATLAILGHDPAWAWLHDEAEDIYSQRPAVTARGDVVLARFPFADRRGAKLRPGLVLARTPGPHNDFLVLFISSQVRIAVPGVDIILDRQHPAFARSGLKLPSGSADRQVGDHLQRSDRRTARSNPRSAPVRRGRAAGTHPRRLRFALNR